jgi:predicted RND superfamily exporter protein/signal transduction histidine kinase
VYRLTRLSLRAPAATAVVLLAATIALGAGLLRLHSEFGYRPLLGGKHPAIRTLERFIGTYGGGFPLLIVWECGAGHPCRSALDTSSLVMASQLEEGLRWVDGVRSIQSAASTTLLVPGPGGFAVRRFFEDGAPVEDADFLAARALADPLWVGSLVSADGSVGSIIVFLTDSKSETMVHVVEAVETALLPFEDQGFDFRLAGHPIESVVAGKDLADSTAALTPVIVVIIGLIIFALTRSWQGVVVTLVTMGVALLWTFGLLGWLGWPHDSILQVLAPLLLVIGVCDAVHVFSRTATELRAQGSAGAREDRTRAVLSAVKDVGGPCVVTTVTTALAFLSFLTSNLATFVRFGSIAAFGVAACLVLTFTLLPVLVRALPAMAVRPATRGNTWDAVLQAISDTAEKRALPILIAAGLLFAIGAVGWVGYLRVDTEIGEMYGDNSRVTRWIRFVDERLRGLDSLEIDVALPEGAPIESPETQAQLSRFAAFLEETDGLGRVTSVQDLISRLNRLLHDDDPAFERTGETAAENGEILELVGMDDPDTLGYWLSFDRSRTRISAEGPSDSAKGRGEVLAEVRRFVDAELPDDWEVTLTGPFALEFDWVTEIETTQLRSFATAFALVFVLVVFFLRSGSLGAIAMVPALLPVVVTLGFMGFSGLSLDVGRVMIAAIVIGIAVDDSVHLLGQYHRRLKLGQSSRDAMRASILHVGRAVVVTSLALALGFLTLLGSAWQSISSFGFFVSVAILGALAAALFVLPAIVFLRHRAPGQGLEQAAGGRQAASAAQKTALLCVALLSVVAALLMAALPALRGETQRALPCWVLPNGRVLDLPVLSSACPLQGNDRIERLQIEDRTTIPPGDLPALSSVLAEARGDVRIVVLRDGSKLTVEVPAAQEAPLGLAMRVATAALIAGVLLAIPILLLWRSPSPAAPPLTLFYAAAAVLVTTLLCGQTSPTLHRLSLVALVAAPATLAHLGLTFPRERAIVRRWPLLMLVPYAAAGLLLPAAWVALERFPALWPPVLDLILVLCGGAWLTVLVSSWFAIRESSSALERARARLLLYANLVLPAIPAVLVARAGLTSAALTYLAAAAMALPLPIALAISRYNLFDLESDVRRAVSRVFYVTLAAATVTVGFTALGLTDPVHGVPRLFALSLLCIALAEAFRRPLLGYFEARFARRQIELGVLRDEFLDAMGELREPDEIAQLLGRTLQRALAPRALCVFLAEGSVWRAACPLGAEPPTDPALAAQGWDLARTEPLVHLAEALEDRRPDPLRGAGVELVARLSRGDRAVGLVLLKSSARNAPYTGIEVDLVSRVAGAAALALHNARMAEDLIFAELHANTARVALALVHQIGKELDWIRRLAKRLPQRFSEPQLATEDAELIRELSEDANRLAHGFVDEATHTSSSAGIRTLDALIDHAVQVVARRHGAARVSRVTDPAVQWSPVEESVESVLVNLLDNALEASPPDSPVHVFATRDGPWVEIAVRDRGCGMTPEILTACCDRGFTTRAAGEGHGIGLAVSKETVIALGGTLELESTLGEGTVATLRLPASEGREPQRS